MRILASCRAPLLTAATVASGWSQDPVKEIGKDAPPIKVEVRLIDVTFTVRTSDGKLAQNLTADDFEVFEDGVLQTIKFFGRSTDLPLRLGLLVDGSGSQGRFNSQHQADITQFLKDVISPRDCAMLVGFGNHVRLASDFTSSVPDLIEAFTRYRHGANGMIELNPDGTRSGGTALFDAIYAATTDKLAAISGERKAIVLFSDGEDNSSAHDVVDAIDAAQSTDTLIYTVRYTEAKKNRLTARNRFGITEMNRLAKDTGGAAFDASGGGVAESLASIGEELRSVYSVGYTPSNLEPDGSFRKITIRIKKAGVIVREKSGYYANRSGAGPSPRR